MPVEKLSVSFRPEVVTEIDRRGGERSTVIGRSLERYFALLDGARRQLRQVITDAEMGLILDVLNGTLFSETFSIQLVASEIEDSLVDGYAGKWKCDGPALVQKLKGLSVIENMALVDAVERWWNRVGHGENNLKPSEALKPLQSDKDL